MNEIYCRCDRRGCAHSARIAKRGAARAARRAGPREIFAALAAEAAEDAREAAAARLAEAVAAPEGYWERFE